MSINYIIINLNQPIFRFYDNYDNISHHDFISYLFLFFNIKNQLINNYSFLYYQALPMKAYFFKEIIKNRCLFYLNYFLYQ